MLKVTNLTVKYGPCTIVDNVNFSLQPGQWLMVVGPNGAGKSTLINALTGGTPATGSVLFENRDVHMMKHVERARCMGVLLQSHSPGYSFTVEDVVKLGRYSWRRGLFSSPTEADGKLVEDALEQTGMIAQRSQNVLTLSGGELQRTFLAQLLAQNPRLLILDEPANHLDLVYQRQVFDLVEQWIQHTGRAAISVVHDLSLARAYGTHGMLMQAGKCVAFGEKDDVMRGQTLDTVYQMDVCQWMRTMLGQWA